MDMHRELSDHLCKEYLEAVKARIQEQYTEYREPTVAEQRHIDYLEEMGDEEQLAEKLEKMRKKPKVTIISFNGSRFDNHLLFERLAEHCPTDISKLILKGPSIVKFKALAGSRRNCFRLSNTSQAAEIACRW
eukprot:CAMPEP_0184676224 /NCGR_PEP_ID=MMETSP0308-20130426/88237_1 /TAXON_ID=38269 /ORGANISM="Gloeochaete witrockiana, Strain SAG 46.84" /LENGTH=132 /DNA_ID=CAMNT_0027124039 /DNA_START=44 /DNA_END=439 /DNA_ORIENTATION=+